MDDHSDIKIGLALGAGGLKGLAHIGVIEALQEEGVRIDCVSGCSIGSIVASLFACGVSMETLAKIAERLDEKAVFDLTTPRQGFIKGEKLESLIKTLTADRAFSDVPMPLAVIATDYTHADCVTFKTGDPEKLYRGIHASCAIPGVFVPVECRGTLLVDGGLIRRLPTKECRDMGADVVITVDIGFRDTEELKAGNVLEIISNTVEIMQWQMVLKTESENDIMIRPNVFNYDVLRFRDQSRIVEEGRKAAKAMIPAIRQRLDEASLLKASMSEAAQSLGTNERNV